MPKNMVASPLTRDRSTALPPPAAANSTNNDRSPNRNPAGFPGCPSAAYFDRRRLCFSITPHHTAQRLNPMNQMNRFFSRYIFCLALLALTFESPLAQRAARSDDAVPNNPQPRWWKGNLHTHTLWSDGDDFPEMVAEWYRTRGYNFLALSDHNVLSQGNQPVRVRRQLVHLVVRSGWDMLQRRSLNSRRNYATA